MDRAEAIERFEKQLTAAQVVLDSGFGTKPGENNCLYVVRKEMAAIALEALREQELARNSHDVARACNDPLTLEGLRQMNGEPVWIVWIDGRIVSRWWIVGGHEWNFMGFPDDMKDYGKTWLAYCHKTDDSNASNALDGWISVSERLPQEYGAVCKNVILLMDDGFVTVGWLNQVTRKGYYLDAVNDDVIREPISRFTHWMPLPEPPEEGG